MQCDFLAIFRHYAPAFHVLANENFCKKNFAPRKISQNVLCWFFCKKSNCAGLSYIKNILRFMNKDAKKQQKQRNAVVFVVKVGFMKDYAVPKRP